MSEGWGEDAEGWDSDPDVVAYSEKAFDSLAGVIDISNLSVLDFGCGTGLLTEKLSPYAKEVVALDTSEKMISVLNDKSLTNVTVISEELSEALVIGNRLFEEKFDLIVASSVCGFISEFEEILTVIKSLLKPTGTFIQWDWLSTSEDRDFGFSQEAVEKAYINVGFESWILDVPFSMSSSRGDMPVLMGVAKNAWR
jgi:predicted TPR repeat methyltransferase